MKGRNIFPLYIIIASALLLLPQSSAASPKIETQYYIELPDAFVKTLGTNEEGKANLWHPRLTITKVHSYENPPDLALYDRKVNKSTPTFSSFLQLKQSPDEAAQNLVFIPGSSDSQDAVAKSSKMNCECRFVKDTNGASFIETQSMAVYDKPESAPSLIQKSEKEAPRRGFTEDGADEEDPTVLLEVKTKEPKDREEDELLELLQTKEKRKKDLEEELKEELEKEQKEKERMKLLKMMEEEEMMKEKKKSHRSYDDMDYEESELLALLEKKKRLKEELEEEEMKQKLRKEQELIEMLEMKQRSKKYDSFDDDDDEMFELLAKKEHSKKRYSSDDFDDYSSDSFYRDEILAELEMKEPRHKKNLQDKFQFLLADPSDDIGQNDDFDDFLEFSKMYKKYKQYKSMLTENPQNKKNRRRDSDDWEDEDQDLEDYKLLKKIKSVKNKSLRNELIESLLSE